MIWETHQLNCSGGQNITPLKTMAFKTSNLIPLLAAIPHAWICSSLNLQAMANYLAEKDVCIIAAGGENGVTEDLAVAIALHAHLNHAPFDEQLIAHFILSPCCTAS